MLGFGSKTLLIRRGDKMGRKRYTSEQIIGYLREAEILQAKGSTIPQICKKIGVTEQTYYRWRNEYNQFRPHSSLNYQPPAPVTIKTKVEILT